MRNITLSLILILVGGVAFSGTKSEISSLLESRKKLLENPAKNATKLKKAFKDIELCSDSNNYFTLLKRLYLLQTKLSYTDLRGDTLKKNKQVWLKRIREAKGNKEINNTLYLLYTGYKWGFVDIKNYKYNKALLLYKEGCYSISQQIMIELLKNNKRDYDYNLLLIKIFIKKGEFERAIALGEKYLGTIDKKKDELVFFNMANEMGIVYYRWYKKTKQSEKLTRAFKYFNEAIHKERKKTVKEESGTVTRPYFALKADEVDYELPYSLRVKLNVEQVFGPTCLITKIRPYFSTADGMKIPLETWDISKVSEVLGSPFSTSSYRLGYESNKVTFRFDSLQKYHVVGGKFHLQIYYIKKNEATRGSTYTRNKISLFKDKKELVPIIEKLIAFSELRKFGNFTSLLEKLYRSNKKYSFQLFSNVAWTKNKKIRKKFLKAHDYLYDSTKYRAGLNFCNKYEEYYGKYPNLILLEGSFNLLLGRPEKALEDFKEVIKAAPRNVWGYYNLGLTYLLKNNPQKALKKFDKITEILPSWDLPYLSIGLIYKNRFKNNKQAINYLKKFCERNDTYKVKQIRKKIKKLKEKLE